jgi:hypothetical protein
MSSSLSFVYNQKSARRNNPEDPEINLHRREIHGNLNANIFGFSNHNINNNYGCQT